MSGILGVIDSCRHIRADQWLDDMRMQMSYFPWFTYDKFIDLEFSIALGRMGIGIFNSETQPVVSKNGRFVLFMSGELYETGALKKMLSDRGISISPDCSDAETFLRLFEEFGESFIDQIQGFFCLSIWDKAERQLWIINDHYGLYPVYYIHVAGKFIYSPEIKSILSRSVFEKKIDLSAMAEYMRFQALLGDKTFFEGIRLLRGGSVLKYSATSDEVSIRTYWDLSKLSDEYSSLTFDEAVEESTYLLKKAVDKLNVGNYRNGLLLSGGLDSRVILGSMGPEFSPIHTVTYGLKGCKDEVYAARVAKAINTNHHFLEILDGTWVKDYFDLHLDLTEGFHSWVHAHGINKMDQVMNYFQVNYSGLGGDLWADDFRLYKVRDDLSFTSRVYDLFCQEVNWPGVSEGEAMVCFTPEYANKCKNLAFQSLDFESKRISHLPYHLRAKAILMAYDLRSYFHFVNFHRTHIEDRFPFYDYDYFNFVAIIPIEYKFNRKLRKAVINRHFKNLRMIPYSKDDLPVVEKSSYYIYKTLAKGKRFINTHVRHVFPEYGIFYADYEKWLRGELREWAEGILFGPRMRERGIFNVDYLRSIWGRLMTGEENDLIGKIAPFMTYEMMLQRFLDE